MQVYKRREKKYNYQVEFYDKLMAAEQEGKLKTLSEMDLKWYTREPKERLQKHLEEARTSLHAAEESAMGLKALSQAPAPRRVVRAAIQTCHGRDCAPAGCSPACCGGWRISAPTFCNLAAATPASVALLERVVPAAGTASAVGPVHTCSFPLHILCNC